MGFSQQATLKTATVVNLLFVVGLIFAGPVGAYIGIFDDGYVAEGNTRAANLLAMGLVWHLLALIFALLSFKKHIFLLFSLLAWGIFLGILRAFMTV